MIDRKLSSAGQKRILARVLVTLALFIVPIAHVSAQELAPRTFFEGKLTLLIPVGFEPMTEELMSLKYPHERRPTLVLTNPSGSVNVALNHTQNRVSNAEIPDLHQSMEFMFERLYPTAQWNASSTARKGDRQFFTMDLFTPAIDTDIRNIMYATPLEGRMLLISFNCVRELDAKWGSFGQQIIDSITVVEP